MAKSGKTPARIDHIKKEIILYKWFEEKARYIKNEEYRMLIKLTKDFPTYEIKIRDDIKEKKTQEHYKGLTYDYMKKYIRRNESKETVNEVLSELEDKIFITKCHSNGHRYPIIKKWFLEKYPEVTTNGMPIITDTPLEKVA